MLLIAGDAKAVWPSVALGAALAARRGHRTTYRHLAAAEGRLVRDQRPRYVARSRGEAYSHKRRPWGDRLQPPEQLRCAPRCKR